MQLGQFGRPGTLRPPKLQSDRLSRSHCWALRILVLHTLNLSGVCLVDSLLLSCS